MITKSEHYKRMIKYWNSQVKVSSVFKNDSQIINKILEVIHKRKCKNILEIGCGFAQDTIIIAQKSGCKITCIDFSPKMIEKAKIHIKKEGLEKQINFILDNILDIKLKENFFDGVIAKLVLHHLFPKDDIILACKNIFRSLKPKGIFILVENWANSNPSKYETLAFQLSQRARKIKGIKEVFLNKDEYLKVLKKIGFSNIKWAFIPERIELNRYALNEILRVDVEKTKLNFPRGKIKNLFIIATK